MSDHIFTAGFEHSAGKYVSDDDRSFLNPAQYDISIGGYAYNLAVVTIGNMVGGILFLAVPYFLIGKEKAAKKLKIEKDKVFLLKKNLQNRKNYAIMV